MTTTTTTTGSAAVVEPRHEEESAVFTAPAGMARRRTRTHPRPREADSAELNIPQEFWSPPVVEAHWSGTPPQSLLGWLMPVLAFVSIYVSAVIDIRGHLVAGGWLLGGSVCALLGFGVTGIRHCCRLVRYRRQASR